MVIVIALVQVKHGVDPLALIEGQDLFCVLPDSSQERVSSFALLVSQGEVHTVRQALRFMGENVLLYPGEPERAGYAACARE